MNTIYTARITEARNETARHLSRELGYSHDLQMPARIAFYQAHIAYLDGMLNGIACPRAVADNANWNVTRAILEVRAA